MNLENIKKIEQLNPIYEKMQKEYGDSSLRAITNGGCKENPEICFVFMNPTGKNIASLPEWKGITSPWIGTKNVWKLFFQVGLMKEETFLKIQSIRPQDWDENFAIEVYSELAKRKIFITNLGKCTQIDARPLSNRVYKEYLDLLYKEIELLQPKRIITFGNQVSSIVLNQNICVSKCRKEKFDLLIQEKKYPVYPLYYPIGNGMRNIVFAIEDLKEILSGLENEKKI